MSMLSLQKSLNVSRSLSFGSVRPKVKQAELLLFINQLSVMLDSGVTLSDAVDAIASQTKPGPFQDILLDIADKIKSGDSFSTALSEYPKVFGPMFVSIVEASEASGQMPKMLEVLQGYLESESEIRKQVKGALIYPSIMLLMSIVATFTLMFFVMPRFTKIYESRGQALPKLTQLLMNSSRMLTDFESATMILSVVVAIGASLHYLLSTTRGKEILDLIKIKTPIIGTIFIDTIMTRSMRIIATLVNTGVSLLDALEITSSSCKNRYFQRLWAESIERIKAGYQLSESISLAENGNLVAPGIIQMIRAGEKSGSLGDVCEKVSIFYDKKLKSSIKHVTSLIEPLMITIMGAVIGTIAIALLLPVFRISNVLSH